MKTPNSNSIDAAIPQDERLAVVASLPFFAAHLMCLFAFYTGVTWADAWVCVGLYYVRMWAITAGYHRYFAHRSYKTSRAFQFLLALIGTTAVEKGPLWWAAHHRHHHRFSDQPEDVHSPIQKGFWFSHVGWILCTKYDDTRFDLVKDFARFPELRLINRFHLVPQIALAVALFWVGGFRMLVWGFFISTTVLWHATFTINSMSHIFGRSRYKTNDTSKNNWFFALLTCGDGWHNNHHYHQNTSRHGWFWWELDVSYYSLKLLSWVGVVSELRVPTPAIRDAYLNYSAEERAQLDAPVRLAWTRVGARRLREKASQSTVTESRLAPQVT